MRNKTMTRSYTAKPTLIVNALLLSGAALLSLATHWGTISMMLAA
jgi:hypothetical protein